MPAPAAATTLDALRHTLDTVVERERPRDDPSLPTGLGNLDVMLGGGLPRGRLSELQALRGHGRTTLMRALVAHTLATGRWVAIVVDEGLHFLAGRQAESRAHGARNDDLILGRDCDDIHRSLHR